MSEQLQQLVELSNKLGEPALDAAMLGEGNTSALCDDGTFYVKGSGCSLQTMGAADFVHLRREDVLGLLDELKEDPPSSDRIQEVYAVAKVDPDHPRRPSVETVFHALALGYDGVQFVAHTHPTAVNSLLCNADWRQNLAGRLCPDEAVVLGRESVYVPYIDPGVELAQAIKDGIDEYIAREGEVPKVVYMQNHGFIALAGSATEAYNITAMGIKAARMRLGSLQAGGLNPLDREIIDHLLGRPDEHYRQAQLVAAAKAAKG